MAIFGAGSNWDGNEIKDDFFKNENFVIGWDINDAEDLYSQISSVKVGDIIYLKANRPGSLEIRIKGIGIVKKSLVNQLFDKKENRIKSPIVFFYKRTRPLNKVQSLALKISKIHIEKGYRILFKGNEYIIRGIEEIRNHIEVYAELSIVELRGCFIKDKRPSNLSIAIDDLLSVTRFERGVVGALPSGEANFFRTNALDALFKICIENDLEFQVRYDVGDKRINHRYLDVFQRIGSDNGKRCTYNKDLIDVKKIVHDDDIINRIYPYGKGERLENGYGRRSVL